MSRRADPERIEEARHQATRNRLIGVGMSEETADLWIDAWATQAAKEGVEHGAGYWDAAYRWIAEQRRTRVRP